LADNVAWDLPSGDRATYLCSVQSDTVIDRGSTLEAVFRAPDRYMPLTTTSLFVYLTTDTGFTPTAQMVKTISLNFAGV
jgi:hypothetical protein